MLPEGAFTFNDMTFLIYRKDLSCEYFIFFLFDHTNNSSKQLLSLTDQCQIFAILIESLTRFTVKSIYK